MGDRASVCVDFGNEGKVWLFTKYDGRWMPDWVQSALVRGSKHPNSPWNLAGLIFSEIAGNDEDDWEYGYGISPTMLTTEHEVLVVDCPNRMIRVFDYERVERTLLGELRSMAFDEYARLEYPAEWAYSYTGQ